jgi:hypothetical protein
MTPQPSSDRLPARLRPGPWAALHNVGWSLIYLLLYPVSWLIRLLEKRRERD